MGKLTCPFCEGTQRRRSRRRNLFERVVLRLASLRPYRCLDCNRRFYAAARRHAKAPSEPSLEVPARWGAVALALFFAVPLALGARLLHDTVSPPPVKRGVDRIAAAVPAPAPVPVRFAPAIHAAGKSELRLAEARPETAGPLLRQGAEQRPIGSLQVTGTVSVNASPVTTDTTVFVGDVIRTGADGAARVTVAGNGTLILSEQTELVLSGAPRYLATLRSGVLGIYSLTGARAFQVRVGNYLVVPAPDAPATAEVRLAADGSAQVACQNGSIGLIALEGEEVRFLSAGETARIGPGGTLAQPQPPPPTEPPPPPPRTGGGVNRGVVIAILVGGGAAGAALALGRGKKEQAPISPSVP
jgi:hypothetical protein